MFDRIKELLGAKNVPKEKLRIEKNRLSWDEFFLLQALLVSLRSHDPQTQCGCVLVSNNNTILSTGYNGFIRYFDDKVLPNLRPYKYDFMIHAEHNAILNCAMNGISTNNAKAYITGMPCNNCLQYMWQAGIKKIIFSDFCKPVMCTDLSFYNKQKALFTAYQGLDLEFCYYPAKNIQTEFLKEFVKKFESAHVGGV